MLLPPSLILLTQNMQAASVAIYLFIITNIGGNAPLLVGPFKGLFPGEDSLRNALLILFPGTYFISSVLILVLMVSQDDVVCAVL